MRDSDMRDTDMRDTDMRDTDMRDIRHRHEGHRHERHRHEGHRHEGHRHEDTDTRDIRLQFPAEITYKHNLIKWDIYVVPETSYNKLSLGCWCLNIDY